MARDREARRAALRGVLSQTEPPEWVREMRAHYQRTGYYRAQDLDRAFGRQTRRVEVNADLDAVLQNVSRRS